MKLYLDTSTAKKAKVDLINGKNLIDSVETDSPLKSIDKILKKNKLKPEDIQEFEANPGPGSFTGLRIGAAVVNALNFALGRKNKPSELKYE